jgi:hypothetical protein
MHLIMDLKCGLAASDSGALSCFLIQPFGIMFEDGCQELFRRAKRAFGNTEADSKDTPLWRKLVGFIWVVVFLAVVTPHYNYPLNRILDVSKNGVPFSIVGRYLN